MPIHPRRSPRPHRSAALVTRLVVTVVVASLAVACAGPGGRGGGTLVEAASDPANGWTTLVVDLEHGEVAGSNRVVLGAPADDITCDNGATPVVADLVAGSRVRFDLVDDGVDTSDPPGVRATNVQVAC